MCSRGWWFQLKSKRVGEREAKVKRRYVCGVLRESERKSKRTRRGGDHAKMRVRLGMWKVGFGGITTGGKKGRRARMVQGEEVVRRGAWGGKEKVASEDRRCERGVRQPGLVVQGHLLEKGNTRGISLSR